MKKPKPIALVISDLHLSLTPPACRANERDWLGRQEYYLQQVRDMAGIHGNSATPLRVLCAGDVFDRWNAPAELINFALRSLPDNMICIPGQHDLPNHRLEDKHRSAYGVLQEAQKIIDITDLNAYYPPTHEYVVRGFGWGQEIEPAPTKVKALKIALVHRYCWAGDAKFPGAEERLHASYYGGALAGYDVAFFGDNHIPFLSKTKEGCQIINCGGFLRRRSDEKHHMPSMWALMSDGDVVRHVIDGNGDQFIEGVEETPEVPLNMRDFVDGLVKLGEEAMNFSELVKRKLQDEDIDAQTREIVLRCLQNQS